MNVRNEPVDVILCGAYGKQRGFSPGVAARHSQSGRALNFFEEEPLSFFLCLRVEFLIEN